MQDHNFIVLPRVNPPKTYCSSCGTEIEKNMIFRCNVCGGWKEICSECNEKNPICTCGGKFQRDILRPSRNNFNPYLKL